MERLVDDLRYAARRLTRAPGFAAVVILTLALGIGVNTAVFSFVDGILWQPLPHPRPEQLVRVWESRPEKGFARANVAPAEFLYWRTHSRLFQDVAAYSMLRANVTGGDQPERGVAGPGKIPSASGCGRDRGARTRPRGSRWWGWSVT